MDDLDDLAAAVRRTRVEWEVFRRLRRCAGPFADSVSACAAWNRMEAAVGALEARVGTTSPWSTRGPGGLR